MLGKLAYMFPLCSCLYPPMGHKGFTMAPEEGHSPGMLFRICLGIFFPLYSLPAQDPDLGRSYTLFSELAWRWVLTYRPVLT